MVTAARCRQKDRAPLGFSAVRIAFIDLSNCMKYVIGASSAFWPFDQEVTPPPVAPLVEAGVCRGSDHGVADVELANRADAVQGVEEPQWALGGELGFELTLLHANT